MDSNCMKTPEFSPAILSPVAHWWMELTPDLVPLPTANATYVHVRVANLLGSFYEFCTLKLIFTACTAAYLSLIHI